MSTQSTLLFDSGYLFFYRFHATMKYLKFRNPDEDPDPDILKNCFLDHLEKQIIKTKKKFKATSIIFCLDVSLKNIWRYELFNEYKGTREHDISILPDVRKEIRVLMNKYGKCFTHPKLEADDIAYLCVKHLRQSKNEADINIITNDNDFLQMLKYKNVKIYNGGLKQIVGSGDPRQDLWIKILTGDKSDNIPSICGKKMALKLMNDPDELEKYLMKKQLKERFELNKRLIDMDNIPLKYENDFVKSYLEIL